MDIHYIYDGSFLGFLCCVFESYAADEIPRSISSSNQVQQTLFDFGYKEIVTDESRAQRVLRSLRPRMGQDAYDMLLQSFLICLPERAHYMLLFLRAGFRYGPSVMNRMADPQLRPLFKAVQHLNNEVHHYAGFVRFSIHDGRMYSQIKPKNRVLPLLRPHFCQRYPEESFLIYDRSHKEALLYENRRHVFLQLAEWTMPEPDACESAYREMWKLFYNRVAIESRINPKLQRNHLPHRFRPDMTEF